MRLSDLIIEKKCLAELIKSVDISLKIEGNSREIIERLEEIQEFAVERYMQINEEINIKKT